MHHYLRPLICPKTVALVGASERAGSLGRVVLENLLAGGYRGELFAVNPNHRTVLGQRSYDSIASIGKTIDLAVIAAPPAAVVSVLEANQSSIGAAVVMTAPTANDSAEAHAWSRKIAAIARKRKFRLVGPGALGVIRTDIGLNATFCAPAALPGRLALIAQSGAVATAMLDFAAPLSIGFSTVISLGGGVDVGFGELLDSLVLDSATDAILLYIEHPGDARTFLSALRAAARTKPVVVLKAGRSLESTREPTPDAVFDAALTRSGTLRVHTYTQWFAAARILSMARIPGGDRLAVVSNGRGPALLAADSAVERSVPLARFAPETVAALESMLPDRCELQNPIDVRGNAPPERFASAIAVALRDPGVDAVLALHVARPVTNAVETARAVADVAREIHKPILGAWLGAVDRHEVEAALEAGGIPNFFTPENAVDALACVAGYRRNQAWLLEVPSPQPEPAIPDLAQAERIRARAEHDAARRLPDDDAYALLGVFDIAVKRNAKANERPTARRAGASSCAIGMTLDAVFGPIIHFGVAGHSRALMLPPLNRRLAGDLIDAALGPAHAVDDVRRRSLENALVGVSALICALPWVRELQLDLAFVAGRARVASARVEVDPKKKPSPGYRHMAIHPYPIELAADIALRDGTNVHVRPIRPEDAELEREFVHGLSDEARFFRFFYQLHELTPAMLARFTQVDYDRELALVALAATDGRERFVAVARFIANPDRESAEFAIVVADAWQSRGVGRLLMKRLIDAARHRRLQRLEGAVLRSNERMLRFTQALGFRAHDDPAEPEQVKVTLSL